jgi:Fungal specific transcription factor domain
MAVRRVTSRMMRIRSMVGVLHSTSSKAASIEADTPSETRSRRYSVHGFLQASPFGAPVPTLASPPVNLARKEEENDDSDDYDDIEMEDSLDLAELGHGREQQLAELLGRSQKHPAPGAKPRARVPSSRALQTAHQPMLLSPLQDERNERLFCHFVEVAGRCMTIFERPATDTWSLPPRTLWSYTLPSAAMSHPALAHAMLALSGLHVAKLQQSSEDPSLKHFTYALRRVGNLLGLPKRRHEITTLATVLLLGFYEVLAADHSRWNLHLTGATRLVLEHDYAAMIRTARRMRNHAKENISQFSERSALTEENYLAVAGIPESLLDDEEWEVDQDLISTLTGQEVNYDHQIQPNFAGSNILDDFSDKAVAEVKIKMDLRWWYCKQDVFQSMISGDPLLMDYDQWKYCPPRGRIGNANMPYGTFDHLLLILGRLSNFGGKDRSRKQRVVATQGGQWRPPPGLFPPGPPSTAPPTWNANAPGHPPSVLIASAPGPSQTITKAEDVPKPSPAPSANEGRVRQSKPGPVGPQPPSSAPSFHGMMPPPPVAPKMHSSFYAMNEKQQGKHTSNVKSELDEEFPTRPDLKHETDQAVAEHTAIAKAFDVFAKSLGPDFEPLVNDGSFPQTSPFGPPLRYQSPAIAAIWLHYYVGRILLHRLHPHMPPAAMVAASVTAHLTREHAQNVGKAAAGLYAMSLGGPGDPLDPTYAGALIESTFPLLFAAVQFQDASQRGWTISKLHDIARMTGWQTSGAVAGACEIAWERMGQAGKGPPYTRSLDRGNRDARVNGASRKIDARSTGDYAGPADTGAEEESQFVSHNRALIGEHGPTRVHWALGLLSVEEDIKKLDIGK